MINTLIFMKQIFKSLSLSVYVGPTLSVLYSCGFNYVSPSGTIHCERNFTALVWCDPGIISGEGTQQTWDVDPMLFQCWVSVADLGRHLMLCSACHQVPRLQRTGWRWKKAACSTRGDLSRKSMALCGMKQDSCWTHFTSHTTVN